MLRILDWGSLAGLGETLCVIRQSGPAGDWLNIGWPGLAGAITALAPQGLVEQLEGRWSGAGPWPAKFDARGNKPVLQFGMNAGSGPGQFKGATDLAVDNRNGDVYVVPVAGGVPRNIVDVRVRRRQLQLLVFVVGAGRVPGG